MDNQTELIELADLFLQNEKILADYYALCLEKFPANQASWEVLIRNENDHADIFEKVKKAAKERPNLWKKGRFQAQTVLLMIEETKKRKKEFSEGKINSKYALNYIMDVEQSLIETEMVKAFQTEDPEFLALLNRVQSETINHKNLLKNIIEKMK